MIKFQQFERQYETATSALDEGAVDGLKNFLSRLFGGKVKKIDDIVRALREADSEYWKEWSDYTFKYNAANLIRGRAASQLERAKQEEVMARIKKTTDTLSSSRESYKQSLEKQAQLIIGSNDRLRDYYSMQKAKMDAEVAQQSYEEVLKISDEKLIADAYDRLSDTLATVKQHDGEFKDKYGENYQKNLFGMTDHDFGHYGHGFTDDASVDSFVTMDDRTFAHAVSRMTVDDAEDLQDKLKNELKKLREQLDKQQEDSKSRIDAAGKDHAELKKEKEQARFSERDTSDKIKRISKKIGVLAGFAAGGYIPRVH